MAEKAAGNKRDEGNDGDGQWWLLAFDGGNGWQQQQWQWRTNIAFNGGSNRQRQVGGEKTGQWTTTAVATATTMTVAMTTTIATAVAATTTMTTTMAMAVGTATAAGTDNNQLKVTAEETTVAEATAEMTMTTMAAAKTHDVRIGTHTMMDPPLVGFYTPLCQTLQ